MVLYKKGFSLVDFGVEYCFIYILSNSDLHELLYLWLYYFRDIDVLGLTTPGNKPYCVQYWVSLDSILFEALLAYSASFASRLVAELGLTGWYA